MVRRHLMLWLLLIVVGFNSMIGLPMHEAMHLENDHVEVVRTTESGMSVEDVHSGAAEDDRCTSCDAFMQLSMAFIPRPLEKAAHNNPILLAAIPCSAPFLSIWHAHSSGLDPPASIA